VSGIMGLPLASSSIYSFGKDIGKQDYPLKRDLLLFCGYLVSCIVARSSAKMTPADHMSYANP